MTYASRLTLGALLTLCACREDDPGLGTGTTDAATSSTGGDTTGADTTVGDATGSSGGETWAEICDGSDDLRLAMTLVGGGTVENELVREIGWRYLYVLGTCEYFVLPLGDPNGWPDARTGVLDLEAEQALSEALDYGNLEAVAGNWGTEGTFDASTLLVSDGTHIVSCNGECLDGPREAQALWGEMSRIDELWAESEPYLGPVRVSVIGWEDSLIDELGVNWPLELDPWSIAIDGSSLDDPPTAGTSVLVDDPEAVAQLRELRRQYREDDLPEGVPNSLAAYGHLTFTSHDGQDLFQLWMRDSLPIEAEDGLIPLP